MEVKYDLEDGINICKYIEPILAENGLHCALAGSLVYKGWSNKDIDIFIYNHRPSDVESTHPIKVTALLKEIFKKRIELTDNSTGTNYADLIKAKVKGQAKVYTIDFFHHN